MFQNQINHTSLQARGVTTPKPKEVPEKPIQPHQFDLNPRVCQNQIDHTSVQASGVIKPKPKEVPEPNQPHQFAGQWCD